MDVKGSRLELSGPDSVVTPEAAQAIGLAVHELSTNAIKYGALSVPSGKIRISWNFDEGAPPQLMLSWIEQGGPSVTPPARKGFGHVVIGEMIERSLNGTVALDFPPSGLQWRVLLPAEHLVGDGVGHG